VFVDRLKLAKGSDASNAHDEEPGEDEVEFSDDEREAAYKRMLKERFSLPFDFPCPSSHPLFVIGVQILGRPHAHQPLVRRREETISMTRSEKATTLTANTAPMIWITEQAHLGHYPFLTTTLTTILSPALQLTEMEETADSLTASEIEMPLVVTIRSAQALWVLLGLLTVVSGAATRTIGIWTTAPGITIREGEEGVVVEIDNLTGAGEVVVGETRYARLGTNHTRNRVVYMTIPAWHLRAVSAIRTANNQITGALLGNGVTGHL